MRMRQFLRSLWQHRQGGSPRPRPGRRAAVYRPLILEALEDRTVPSHASSHPLMSGAGFTGSSMCQCGCSTSGSSSVDTQLLQTLLTGQSGVTTILNTLATDPTTGLTALAGQLPNATGSQLTTLLNTTIPKTLTTAQNGVNGIADLLQGGLVGGACSQTIQLLESVLQDIRQGLTGALDEVNAIGSQLPKLTGSDLSDTETLLGTLLTTVATNATSVADDLTTLSGQLPDILQGTTDPTSTLLDIVTSNLDTAAASLTALSGALPTLAGATGINATQLFNGIVKAVGSDANAISGDLNTLAGLLLSIGSLPLSDAQTLLGMLTPISTSLTSAASSLGTISTSPSLTSLAGGSLSSSTIQDFSDQLMNAQDSLNRLAGDLGALANLPPTITQSQLNNALGLVGHQIDQATADLSGFQGGQGTCNQCGTCGQCKTCNQCGTCGQCKTCNQCECENHHGKGEKHHGKGEKHQEKGEKHQEKGEKHQEKGDDHHGKGGHDHGKGGHGHDDD